MIRGSNRVLPAWLSRYKYNLTKRNRNKLELEPTSASSPPTSLHVRSKMKPSYTRLWREEEGQDIAEYAVMLAVVLAIVVATVQLIGKSANNVFSSVASSIQ